MCGDDMQGRRDVCERHFKVHPITRPQRSIGLHMLCHAKLSSERRSASGDPRGCPATTIGPSCCSSHLRLVRAVQLHSRHRSHKKGAKCVARQRQPLQLLIPHGKNGGAGGHAKKPAHATPIIVATCMDVVTGIGCVQWLACCCFSALSWGRHQTLSTIKAMEMIKVVMMNSWRLPPDMPSPTLRKLGPRAAREAQGGGRTPCPGQGVKTNSCKGASHHHSAVLLLTALQPRPVPHGGLALHTPACPTPQPP